MREVTWSIPDELYCTEWYGAHFYKTVIPVIIYSVARLRLMEIISFALVKNLILLGKYAELGMQLFHRGENCIVPFALLHELSKVLYILANF